LIETGYISNPAEAARLKSNSHQAAIARAIFYGVTRYIKRYPPEGSFLAWQRKGGYNKLATYKIESGDTLTAIAEKHRVTAKSLMKINGLNTEMIIAGQVLTIPSSR